MAGDAVAVVVDATNLSLENGIIFRYLDGFAF